MLIGGLAFAPAGCSRTSDGTIVADNPVSMPNFDMPQMSVPSWMRRQPAEPEPVAANFPPPPVVEAAGPPPTRRKARPPVVRSGSGSISCENKTEGGRVRMVCQ